MSTKTPTPAFVSSQCGPGLLSLHDDRMQENKKLESCKPPKPVQTSPPMSCWWQVAAASQTSQAPGNALTTDKPAILPLLASLRGTLASGPLSSIRLRRGLDSCPEGGGGWGDQA